MIDSLLLASARISTYRREQLLTNASGFFFERDERLFLVTSRHVVIDQPSEHFPDSLLIEFHTDANNMTQSTTYSIPLYRNGTSVWRQGTDSGGEVDVAVVELERAAIGSNMVFRAFNPSHLQRPGEHVEVGTPLLIIGFPLGFHDTLHHLPVARRAVTASSYGLRFQGNGYFLTDARLHRGTSGSPVVMRAQHLDFQLGDLPWKLLGVHSSRLDIGSRDLQQDEALGLNCAWYADILLTLTEN